MSLAAFTTPALVLPASVMIMLSVKWGAISANTDAIAPMGTANKITSASATAASIDAAAVSIIPKDNARSRVASFLA